MDTDIPGNQFRRGYQYFRKISSSEFSSNEDANIPGKSALTWIPNPILNSAFGFDLSFGYMDDFSLGFRYMGFGFRFLGIGYILGFGLWFLGVSTSDFWFDFPLQTLLNGHISIMELEISPFGFYWMGMFPLQILSDWTFIMLGEDDG
ncbi:hypothetical protein RhiirA1_459166 [Rhizophagus irregularis]|uniref:Uncharacterized protein n=1 Tax=Rhizophagus irregularis TaxID=588596 RepID=A0A2N0RU84_9GLOM|nr:hypothetical protein RhiirA1_459166 [Rhizophagus irregularis]